MWMTKLQSICWKLDLHNDCWLKTLRYFFFFKDANSQRHNSDLIKQSNHGDMMCSLLW